MADQTQLTVALTPEQGKFVSEQLAAGRYRSASEVVSEGLRLLQQQDRASDADLDAVRAKIAVGLEQLDRGEVYEKEQVFQELRERSRSSRGKGG